MRVVTVHNRPGNEIWTPGGGFRSGTFFDENLKILDFHIFPDFFQIYFSIPKN